MWYITIQYSVRCHSQHPVITLVKKKEIRIHKKMMSECDYISKREISHYKERYFTNIAQSCPNPYIRISKEFQETEVP